MTALVVRCRHCQRTNEIIAIQVNQAAEVTCSYCQKELGQLGRLKNEVPQFDAPEREDDRRAPASE